jgi:hypothetical protein
MILFSRAEFNKGDDSKNVRSIIKEHVHQFSSNTYIIPHPDNRYLQSKMRPSSRFKIHAMDKFPLICMGI